MAAGIQFESLVDLEEEVNLAITGPVTIIRSWRSNFPIRSSREFRVFELAAEIRLGHFSAAEQPIRMKVSREEESHLVHTWAHSHQNLGRRTESCARRGKHLVPGHHSYLGHVSIDSRGKLSSRRKRTLSHRDHSSAAGHLIFLFLHRIDAILTEQRRVFELAAEFRPRHSPAAKQSI